MEHIEKALAKARREGKQPGSRREGAPDVLAGPNGQANPRPIPNEVGGTVPTEAVAQDAPSRAREAPIPGASLIALNYQNPIADLFRILRTQILKALAKNGGTTFGICSGNPGEGKTFVATNLAASVALSRGKSVLLIDFDLRRPSVHTAFGVDPSPGVTDYLIGSATLSDCVRGTPVPGLQIWTAGAPIRNSSEALGSSELARAFENLRSEQPDRILICDLPPLLVSDDALLFSSRLDATVLVVQENRTRPGEIQRSLELLEPTKVIGTILNRSQFNNPFPYAPYSE